MCQTKKVAVQFSGTSGGEYNIMFTTVYYSITDDSNFLLYSLGLIIERVKFR